MDTIAATRTFLRAVEAGSFSKVAREMNTSQPTISKQIAALEDRLGVQLLIRSTRSLSLTDEGARFYERATEAVDAFGAAEAAARGENAIEGRLRIGCPTAFGHLHIVPHVPAFLDAHPAVGVELAMSDAILDPVEQGVDLDIRIGKLKDSALKARRIGSARRVTVASPDYLDRRGTPAIPNDLDDHDCVVFTRLQTGNAWPYRIDGETIDVPIEGRFRADNSIAVKEATLLGLGIALVPLWLVGQEIDAGKLTVLLGDHDPDPFPVSAVMPPRRFTPPKVRAFVDYLADIYRSDPCVSDVARH